MILDSSAVIAILQREPGWELLEEAIRRSDRPMMSAATYVELGVVVDRRQDRAVSRRLDGLLHSWNVTIVPLTVDQASIARNAYADFGRGTGHAAGLNLGDCFSYALAIHTGAALLFTGNDFTHTDVTAALPG